MKQLRWRWVLLIACVPLLGWWSFGIFDLDEGFYAAISTEMNLRGEWITPIFQGKPWYEKPILLYWLAKPSIAWFGEAVGPRLPSVLATGTLYFLVGWFARRHLSDRASKLSVLILASCLLTVVVGKLMLTDALLVVCFSAAMLAFYESLVGSPRWRLACAAALGLSVLAKGPVTLVLFGAVAATMFAFEPRLRPSFKGQWLTGTLILAAVVGSWYVPAYLAGGQLFIQKFLIEQNIGRFSGFDPAHSLPLWPGILFFPAVLLLGAFPWIELSFRTKWWRPADSLDRYLIAWIVAVLVFFTLSSAKLPHYIAPLMPALAILSARRIEHWPGRWLTFAAIWSVALGLLVQGAGQWWYVASGHAEVHALTREARQSGLPVTEFQMPKQPGEVVDKASKLALTGHPSITLYLGRSPQRAPSLRELGSEQLPSLVLTRQGRLTDEGIAHLAERGVRAVLQETRQKQTRYALWRLESIQ